MLSTISSAASRGTRATGAERRTLQLRAQGRSIVDAAIESARIRLRPILMTSFAFILGVLPLALATGAGSGARNSVGTAVAGGMLASTFLSIVFIPVLYVIIRTIAPGQTRHA